MSIDIQKEFIHRGNWDTLVVLDACRYDVFRDVYQRYLSGNLEPVKTGVDNTGAWLKKTFPGYYDLVYVSGTPHINSWGLSLSETNNEWEWNWAAKKHFKEIVDVWDFGFDKNVGTVRPEAITETGLKLSSDKKILHYVQPHFPSLLLEHQSRNSGEENGLRKENLNPVKKKIEKVIRRVFNDKIFIHLKDFIGSTTNGYAGCYLSDEGIEYHYRKNIELALESLSRYVENRNEETVIVTADHGEYLGENGHFGHKEMSVPWMRVEK